MAQDPMRFERQLSSTIHYIMNPLGYSAENTFYTREADRRRIMDFWAGKDDYDDFLKRLYGKGFKRSRSATGKS